MSAEWATTTIGEITKLVAGRKPPLRPIPRQGDLPFLSAKVMRGAQSPEYGDPTNRNSVLASADDLVMICTGSNSGEVFTGKAGIVASTMARIDVSPSFDRDFVRNFLQMHFSLLNGAMKGMAIPSLDRQLLSALTIPAPPLAEQKRIVRVLDKALVKIALAKANAEKNLQNAHELLDSQMQAHFGQVDNDWREVQLGTLCTVDWGNTKLTKSAYVEGGEYLAVSAAGCDGRISHKEHAKFTPVLSAIGAQCGRMFLPDEDFTAIKNTITLTPKDGTCTGKFLYRLLTYVELPKRGAAQPFISKGDIQTFSVSVPPLTTQERVVELIEKLEKHTDELAQVNEEKLAQLDALKHSLLHQAFTGDFKILL